MVQEWRQSYLRSPRVMVLLMVTLTLEAASDETFASVFELENTAPMTGLRPVITVNTATWWTRPHVKSLLLRLAPHGQHRRVSEALPPAPNASTPHADYHKNNRVRRQVFHRGPRYLEVLLVTDNSLVDFHGEPLVHQYLYTQMLLVDEAFHHSSLGVEFNIHVVGIERFNDEQSARTVVSGDGKETLNRFCQWVYMEKENRVENQFDIAVYITKKHIKPAGYAPVTGMCNSKRSCAIVRDDGITSSYIIAHEIGHIIGMPHDGYGNRCERNSRDGKIMGSVVQSSYTNYYWTDCSRLAMEQYISNLRCLNDRPGDPYWPNLPQPFGLSWSFDQQCRQEFGSDYVLCRGLSPGMDPCGVLWCGLERDIHFCKTKGASPLPGTSCGRGRWCIDGTCQAKSNVVVDGGWSAWHDWGVCSLTCGAGVMYRVRACTNPRARHGGRDCQGDSEEMTLCNTEKCQEITDIRHEQCVEQNDINYAGAMRHNWLPMESKTEEKQCFLTCVSEDTGLEMVTDFHVVDGTFCSYEDRSGICIRGQCQSIGCDLKLNSNKRDDRCGVCQGDGTTCTEISGAVNNSLPVNEYHVLVVLPSGMRNLQMHELNRYHGAYFFAVRDVETGKWFLNGNAEKSHTTQNFVLNGALFHYIDGDYGERLHAKGPLLRDVEIMVFTTTTIAPPEIRFSFTVPLEVKNSIVNHIIPERDERRYIWGLKRWTECSVTCGGGIQQQEFMCMDQKLMAVVAGMCDYSKLLRETRSCNEFSCALYRWEIRKWEDGCSTSCGKDGVQRAYIDCLYRPRYTKNDVIMDYRYCGHLMPPQHSRPCNNSPCTARWLVKGWSKCSVTCGEGVKMRKVYCDPYYNYNPNFECPSASKPPHTATCRLSDCPEVPTTLSTSPKPTTRMMTSPTPIPKRLDNSSDRESNHVDSCLDKSESYCARFAGRKRCKIPRFKSVCCAICTERHSSRTIE